MSETIRGVVRAVFHAAPTFSAGVLDVEDGTATYRAAFHTKAGESLALTGAWEHHPKYGYQFAASGVVHAFPETPEGLARYLAVNPEFKGVGEATARRLVRYAGSAEKLDRLIRHDTKALRRDLRIPVATLKTLHDRWIALGDRNAVRARLAAWGLTPRETDVLLDRFGDGVVGILETEPYMTVGRVRNFGFKRIDRIARKTGVPKTRPDRIAAALLHAVRDAAEHGDTWIDAGDLVRAADALLFLDDLDAKDRIRTVAKELVDAGDLVAEDRAVALPALRDAEAVVADVLEEARRPGPAPIRRRPPDGLREGQRRAFAAAMEHRLLVVSGKAGTGKSHLVGALVRAWREEGLRIVLCAPTGKAAKRIEEVLREKHDVTDVEARTVHRLLGWDGRVFHAASVDADVLVCDECSMVDAPLCAELLGRVDLSATRVVLVGDHDQLPPVGPGNILRDITTRDLAPTVVLDTVLRNAGPVERAARAILDGVVPPSRSDEPEWSVIDAFRDPEAIRLRLRDLLLHDLPKRFGYDMADVQIITPVHKGPLGTTSVNAMVRSLLHGGTPGRFASGDKVVQTVNDYDLGVMNGHQGVVRCVDEKGVVVAFDGEEPTRIEGKALRNIEPAFCLSCHKAQGSEFPCVVVLCHASHVFADRNWLYTAVTRGSKHVVLLGDRKGVRAAAARNDVRLRRTWLSLWGREGREAIS